MKNSQYFRIISSLFIAGAAFLVIFQYAFANHWLFSQIKLTTPNNPDSTKVYISEPCIMMEQQLPKTVSIEFDVAPSAFTNNSTVNLYIEEEDQMLHTWIKNPGHYSITLTLPVGTAPEWYHYYLIDGNNKQICGAKHFIITGTNPL